MAQRARLFVEGIDDAHAIRNVLWEHGWGEGKIGIRSKVAIEPLIIDPTGNDELALRAFGVELETAERAVGIVLDADEDRKADQRWDQVRSVLGPLSVEMPKEIEPAGFVGIYRTGEIEVSVGVWIMPDNRHVGGIEAFLADLALSDKHRPVLLHARASTQALIDAGLRTFSPPKRTKAELRAFLAWQDEPGCSYGVAVRRRYFDANAEAAQGFANWFRRLYGPPESPT